MQFLLVNLKKKSVPIKGLWEFSFISSFSFFCYISIPHMIKGLFGLPSYSLHLLFRLVKQISKTCPQDTCPTSQCHCWRQCCTERGLLQQAMPRSSWKAHCSLANILLSKRRRVMKDAKGIMTRGQEDTRYDFNMVMIQQCVITRGWKALQHIACSIGVQDMKVKFRVVYISS